jgi:hypothetical protein
LLRTIMENFHPQLRNYLLFQASVRILRVNECYS